MTARNAMDSWLEPALAAASAPPPAPMQRLESAAMSAFPARRAAGARVWAAGLAGVAAMVAVTIGGLGWHQSWQREQTALLTDSDAFAAELIGLSGETADEAGAAGSSVEDSASGSL